ncbi:hypothetical protein FKM82_021525 [Ascaphus truei]
MAPAHDTTSTAGRGISGLRVNPFAASRRYQVILFQARQFRRTIWVCINIRGGPQSESGTSAENTALGKSLRVFFSDLKS